MVFKNNTIPEMELAKDKKRKTQFCDDVSGAAVEGAWQLRSRDQSRDSKPDRPRGKVQFWSVT